MVAKLHFLIRDEDGNLQDLYIPCVLESESALKTNMGIVTPKALEGMVVDVTSVCSAKDIFELWGKNLADMDLDPKIRHDEPRHGKMKCLGYHVAKPTVCHEDYRISLKINEDDRTLGVYHHNDLIAALPIRYCPFCGQML